MENLSIFGDIGNVLGYPAMLLIFWLHIKGQGHGETLATWRFRHERDARAHHRHPY